jgi:YaiO family outer membrane protein
MLNTSRLVRPAVFLLALLAAAGCPTPVRADSTTEAFATAIGFNNAQTGPWEYQGLRYVNGYQGGWEALELDRGADRSPSDSSTALYLNGTLTRDFSRSGYIVVTAGGGDGGALFPTFLASGEADFKLGKDQRWTPYVTTGDSHFASGADSFSYGAGVKYQATPHLIIEGRGQVTHNSGVNALGGGIASIQYNFTRKTAIDGTVYFGPTSYLSYYPGLQPANSQLAGYTAYLNLRQAIAPSWRLHAGLTYLNQVNRLAAGGGYTGRGVTLGLEYVPGITK